MIFADNVKARLLSSLSPDISSVIEHFEARERWTFGRERNSDLYDSIEKVVMASRNLPLAGDNLSIEERLRVVDSIILALSSISFGYSIIALFYLEEAGAEESLTTLVLSRCTELVRSGNSGLGKEAKALLGRVQVFVESGVALSVLSNKIKKELL